jgi:putative nucleotidyltransferase with HDIG domain
MKYLFPEAPDWQVRWEELNAELEWIRGLRGCAQDPEYHAEGDVWVHTRMVCEALAAAEEWRALPHSEREILFAAALMHDIGKPACTRKEGGRIRSPGHAVEGAIESRRILWEMGWPPAIREAVATLVRHHMTPYRLVDVDDAPRRLHFISQTARCDWLAMLAEADIRGRITRDRQALLDNIALFREMSSEESCLTTPRVFPSAHSRFLYFRKEGRDANYLAFDDCRCDVVILSGLPGAGKDTWIAAEARPWEVLSLDAVREELEVSPAGNQGSVISAAREQARIYLRAGRSFIWNATNLSREIRSQVIDLAAAYKARVTIVFVEAPADVLWQRNRRRERPVPETAMQRMLSRWEMPDLTEAHMVQCVARTL